MKNICILGSTGSIGVSSLEVIEGFPDRFRPVCLTANSNVDMLCRAGAEAQTRGRRDPRSGRRRRSSGRG